MKIREMIEDFGAETHHQNQLGWHYTKSSLYTIKFRYWLATHLSDSERGLLQPYGVSYQRNWNKERIILKTQSNKSCMSKML